MKKLLMIGLTAVLSTAIDTGMAADFYLVRDGKPKARILLPQVFGKATAIIAAATHVFYIATQCPTRSESCFCRRLIPAGKFLPTGVGTASPSK